MSRLTRDSTAEPVSRDQIFRHARGQGNIICSCSADHEQDWQPYPVDPYSAICDDHTYIHTYSSCCENLVGDATRQLARQLLPHWSKRPRRPGSKTVVAPNRNVRLPRGDATLARRDERGLAVKRRHPARRDRRPVPSNNVYVLPPIKRRIV